ncbi:WYL domain-containing protein [Marinicrinis sediminis]|uniref:WYL domain-containing protein n=1 Tax=Marinicrinis sediminis TaxID=1652465 RepID=A0ABW5R9Q1_9BACL
MHLFEKIFNYQMMNRLTETGTQAVTTHERAWLKTMLTHPAAQGALSPELFSKLNTLLQEESVLDTTHLTQKGQSSAQPLHHPMLPKLRRMIMNEAGMELVLGNPKTKQWHHRRGLPYKLEFSLVKKEWYLLWIPLKGKGMMATKLNKIKEVHSYPLSDRLIAHLRGRCHAYMETQQKKAVIELLPRYKTELSRILYAFSCFDKKVEVALDQETYRIQLTYLPDEEEYLLSKIRFLGVRIRVVEGARLQARMLQTCTKALHVYDRTE